MRIQNLLQCLSGISAALLVAACSSADNPYARIKDAPLIQARVYTVTLVSDTDAIAGELSEAGLSAVTLPPNYQQADAVEASLWGVRGARGRQGPVFQGGRAGQRRHPVARDAAGGARAAPRIRRSTRRSFATCSGATCPHWPLPGEQPDNVRVQVWGYLVPDILQASKRLRENGIPVIYDAVAITTSYSGTHKTLAIRSPDGTVVQLVETAAE